MKYFKTAAIAIVCLIFTCCGNNSGKRVYVGGAGEGNDLVNLLKEERFQIKESPSVTEALEAAKPGSAVLLIAGGYPDTPVTLTKTDLNTIKEKGLKVFAEFATLPDQNPEIKEIGVERVVVTKEMGDSLRPMDLLTINRAAYLEAEADDPLMVIARVAGFDTAVFGLNDTPSSPLVYKQDENLWISTSKLTDFARLRLIPERKWKPFWETIISELTGRKTVFKNWPTLITPSYSKNQPLPATARRDAVAKGIEWFFNGHFLIHQDWKESWII